MKAVNQFIRFMVVPAMMFLGACCCEKDIAVAPVPVTPPPPPQPAAVAGPVLGDLFFDFDKSTLRAEASDQLKANAAWLKANLKSRVVIEGHCHERQSLIHI